MALSNPLERRAPAGFVGLPLPGVDVRLVDERGRGVPSRHARRDRGARPGVFLEYWARPDATRDAFRDGWFRTGDVGGRRGRLLPDPRPPVGGHHQDRRLQGLGARDRGSPARAPRRPRVRRRRRARRRSGASASRPRSSCGRRRTSRRSRRCASGPARGSRRTSCRRGCASSTTCRATRWARSSRRGSEELF